MYTMLSQYSDCSLIIVTPRPNAHTKPKTNQISSLYFQALYSHGGCYSNGILTFLKNASIWKRANRKS